VPGAVAEQEIAAAVLLNPHRTLGQPEVLAQDFEFGIGRDDRVQGWIEPNDCEGSRRGRLGVNQGDKDQRDQGSHQFKSGDCSRGLLHALFRTCVRFLMRQPADVFTYWSS